MHSVGKELTACGEVCCSLSRCVGRRAQRADLCAASLPLPRRHFYLSSGVPACRYRHLLLDLAQLLPHSKKDSKLDTKSDRGVLNEVADMKARSAGGGSAVHAACILYPVQAEFHKACS